MANLIESNGDLSVLSGTETVKATSGGLYGQLAQELAAPTDHFSEDSVSLLKHHGSYQQDNRDSRKDRKKQGLDKEYYMMVRTKFPGGRITDGQYLLCDELCDELGQHDLRITSRQGFQFHGIVKKNYRPLINKLNTLGQMTTQGGCGDVVRAVVANPVADIDLKYKDAQTDLIELATIMKNRTLPAGNAYFDLFLNDKKMIVHEDGSLSCAENFREEVVDPLYGKQYMPRKFKIGLAIDFDNSIDVYGQDLGILAITEGGRIIGYEILAGGGLGFSHNQEKTYPRAASHVAFVTQEELWPIVEAVIKVQRDYGERTDRKQARLKYTIDRMGVEAFQQKIYEYAGREFEKPRNIKPTAQPDYLGWHKQMQDGYNYVGVWVENGRIRDFAGSHQFKSGLRAIIERFKCDVRLTAHHNVVLAWIKDEDVAAVQAYLDEYHLPTDKNIETIRRQEMACPALPLCGLATSEAERAFPRIMEGLIAAGYGNEDVTIRMTGCPNGCARSSMSEIGIIGKGPERYVLAVGGDYYGTRVNEILLPLIKFDDLVPTIGRLLDLWKELREGEEKFGEWSHRVGNEKLREMLALEPAK